jgi:hypothetical protein
MPSTLLERLALRGIVVPTSSTAAAVRPLLHDSSQQMEPQGSGIDVLTSDADAPAQQLLHENIKKIEPHGDGIDVPTSKAIAPEWLRQVATPLRNKRCCALPIPNSKSMRTDNQSVIHEESPETSHAEVVGPKIQPPMLTQPKMPISSMRASDQKYLVESLARRYFEQGRHSVLAIEQVLCLLEDVVPHSERRHNTAGSGKTPGLGLYSYAGQVDISRSSHEMPFLTRLLSMFCRKASTAFHFTSIQINVNLRSAPHVDANNMSGPGSSKGISFGVHSGGELWVADAGPLTHILAKSIRGRKEYCEGSVIRGKAKGMHHKWVNFDGTKLHFTQPFQGNRISVIFYTNKNWREASAGTLASLDELLGAPGSTI